MSSISQRAASQAPMPSALRHERLLVWMSRTRRACSRGLEKLDGRSARHQATAGKKRQGEFEAIVRMKLQLREQVAQGDAEEGSGREGECDGRPAGGSNRADLLQSDRKQGNAQRDHQGEPGVDQVGKAFRDP